MKNNESNNDEENPTLEGDEMLCCPKCGSTEVMRTIWIDPNGVWDLTGINENKSVPEFYCNESCGSIDGFVTVGEFGKSENKSI